MSPRRLLGLMVCGVGLACGQSETVHRPYDNNDLQLVTAYTAKDFCSCVFVMQMSEEYCRRWTAASPAVAKAHVDYANKSVSTAAVLLWGGKARFLNERDGCQLE